MKILKVIPVLDFGGVESQFITVAENWAPEKGTLEFCTFWKDGEAAHRIRNLGFTVHVLNENPSVRNPKATLALAQLLKTLQPDVVHSTIGEANFHNMLVSKLGAWKCIIEEAGVPNRSLRNRIIHAALYHLADRIVAVSNASAEYVIEREWASPNKVIVLPNSVSQKFYEARRLGHTIGKPVCFRAVGRLTPVKNYPMLIEAFVKAHGINPNIRLEIVGDGEQRRVLETLIAQREASSYISLRGFVSDICALHKDTDFFLMPSLSEGFGIAAAEAMAMGIPGLASDVGGLRTIFGRLSDRFLLPSTDSTQWTERIVTLANLNDEEYLRLSSEFKSESERFRPSRYIADLENLYLDALS